MNARLRFAPLVLVAVLGACSQKAQDQTTNAVTDIGSDIGNATDNAIDATGNALSAAGDSLNPTPTGQEFADKAAKSDAFEIAAAKLAETNGSSVKIKAFASNMIKAHTESTAKIKAAAAKASPAITPDPTLTGEQNDELADLTNLKGAAFDKEYIDGQIDAHDDALELMENFAKDGDVAPLKTAAGEIAPVVKGHLEMAKALEIK